jgi:hypothetical protein
VNSETTCQHRRTSLLCTKPSHDLDHRSNDLKFILPALGACLDGYTHSTNWYVKSTTAQVDSFVYKTHRACPAKWPIGWWVRWYGAKSRRATPRSTFIKVSLSTTRSLFRQQSIHTHNTHNEGSTTNSSSRWSMLFLGVRLGRCRFRRRG